jgi:hypothetical protein
VSAVGRHRDYLGRHMAIDRPVSLSTSNAWQINVTANTLTDMSAVCKPKRYKSLGPMWHQRVTIDKAVNRRYKFHLGVYTFVSTSYSSTSTFFKPALPSVTSSTCRALRLHRRNGTCIDTENPWFGLGTGRSPQTSGSLLDTASDCSL